MLVGGAPALSPDRLVAVDEAITVAAPPARFVSRGGEKLAAALERFDVDVSGRRALDAGASTGGFTDCLLQTGAAAVVAVDVGYGQLHERLRQDSRVTVIDRTNVRHLGLDTVGNEPFDLIVADLSFISLRSVFPTLLGPLAATEADAIVLVKAQFEAGRSEASRGKGVIRDPAVWERVLGEIASSINEHEAVMMDLMPSPLRGADGNVEFLAHLRAHAAADPSRTAVDIAAIVAAIESGV